MFRRLLKPLGCLLTVWILISETTPSRQEITSGPPSERFRTTRVRISSQEEGIAVRSSSKKNILIPVGVVLGLVITVALGACFYCNYRKLKLGKAAKYGLYYDAKSSHTQVQYRAHDPSVGGSSSSYGSTVPLIRQRSMRSRLGSNLTQVSEVEMPLDEKWEIDRENINLLGVLGEGAFGRVMKAEVLGLPSMPFKFNVAVKMLKGGSCILRLSLSASLSLFLIILRRESRLEHRTESLSSVAR